jgi:lipopolysaccharide transport system permease protein
MTVIAERFSGGTGSTDRATPITVIGPWQPGILPRLKEVWRYRAVLGYIAKQFVLRRYRRTYLGPIWILLRPGIDVASRALLFGGFLGVQSGDRPYFIYIAFATAGWVIFERCTYWSLRAVMVIKSIVGTRHFPRAATTVASVAPALIDFVLYALVAIAGTVYYTFRGHYYLAPPAHLVFAASGLVLLLLFALSVGLVVAQLAAITKETRYVFSYVMQLWYFVTPVVYPISSLPDKYQPIAAWNPVTAPIELVKFGLLDTAPPGASSLISCSIVLPLVLLIGLLLTSRFERVAVARL